MELEILEKSEKTRFAYNIGYSLYDQPGELRAIIAQSSDPEFIESLKEGVWQAGYEQQMQDLPELERQGITEEDVRSMYVDRLFDEYVESKQDMLSRDDFFEQWEGKVFGDQQAPETAPEQTHEPQQPEQPKDHISKALDGLFDSIRRKDEPQRGLETNGPVHVPKEEEEEPYSSLADEYMPPKPQYDAPSDEPARPVNRATLFTPEEQFRVERQLASQRARDITSQALRDGREFESQYHREQADIRSREPQGNDPSKTLSAKEREQFQKEQQQEQRARREAADKILDQYHGRKQEPKQEGFLERLNRRQKERQEKQEREHQRSRGRGQG